MKISRVTILFALCLLAAGCMSQDAATKEPVREFIRDLPNHSETQIRAGVAGWLAAEPLTPRHSTDVQGDQAGTIVSDGDMELRPEGSVVSLKVAYTMSVDVRDNRIRVRFTDLRRLYGSSAYHPEAPDLFFGTSAGHPFQEAARVKFAMLLKSLTGFIGVPTGDVAARVQ